MQRKAEQALSTAHDQRRRAEHADAFVDRALRTFGTRPS